MCTIFLVNARFLYFLRFLNQIQPHAHELAGLGVPTAGVFLAFSSVMARMTVVIAVTRVSVVQTCRASNVCLSDL